MYCVCMCAVRQGAPIEPWMTNLSGSRVSAFPTMRVARSSFGIFRLSAKSHATAVDD